MSVAGRQGQSVFLRAFGDFEFATLQLTESRQAGLAHTAWRAYSPAAHTRRVAALEASGLGLGWIDGDTWVTAQPINSPIPTAIRWRSTTRRSTTARPTTSAPP